ncbi:ferredoxin reductase, partial [Pseudomonas aeruginosa]
MSASPSSRLHLQVTDFRAVARDVVLVELAAVDGTELPAFTPGAHLELHLGNGLIRHYSLLNDCRERQRYQLAIGLGDDSRGGARFIHRQLRTGDRLHAAAPRNHFMLREDAARYCFVAGGIGITPILSMVRWCQAQGKDWRLLYAVRERQRAAFLAELMTLGGERTRLHCSDEGDPLDSTALIAGLGVMSR